MITTHNTRSTLNTLASTPVAPLLDRLFNEADEIPPSAAPALAALGKEERKRLMRSKTDYLDLYGQLKNLALPVSRKTGRLLYMLARSSQVKTIVEFGTSFGISTIHLASALRDNGGGHLITTEFEPSKLARARENLTQAALIDLVEIRSGDALQTLGQNLPDAIDLVLLDGAKALYPDVLKRVEKHLKAGALILADNADYSPDYLEVVRSPARGYMSIPFDDDVELSIRLIDGA